MFLGFHVKTELVPTSLKNSFYLIENPINLEVPYRAKISFLAEATCEKCYIVL
jgi:hypothetical protein